MSASSTQPISEKEREAVAWSWNQEGIFETVKLLFFDGNEPSSERIFHNITGHHKLVQIVRTSRFGTYAGHLEAAKGMPSHKGSSATTINIEVSDSKFPFGLSDIFRASGKYTSG